MMIGDATGKGLKAAMFVTQAHGSAHAAALNQSKPDAILREVNAAILSADRPSSEFVTMFCAVLDPQQGRLSYCSAGHPPGILVRLGKSESLELGSLPLAVEPDVDYELCEIRLDPGDAVVMFTDGVTEAMNDEGSEFGQQQLEFVLAQFDRTRADLLTEEVLRHVREFAGPVPQSDDLTLLVISRNA
jgi:sigma-B regulation protein RsbU (phosphoserine phosphatase)